MHISLTTAKGLNSLLPVLLRTYTPDEISGLLGRFKHWRIVHNGLCRALSVAPAEVAAQVRLLFSPDGGLMWDAAPLLALLSAEDMRSLLGDPDAVRLWLRRQSRRPAAERPPGLPTDLSSPRDRCRLLLNIPQLCWVLSESVRWKWDAYQRHAEQLPMALTRYVAPAEVARQSVLRCLLQVELGTLEEDLRTELRMGRSTAASTAHSVRDAMQQMYSDPQTIFSYMRSLPDSWRLRHLLAT
ncbi:hypothetical protein FJT64_018231 [Amphibalanus amphitrite]|uniref:Uncharacterized protein n=1 Tax=Amphibalanus amphitrite TaxID=1232801 RepID=A0A6A4X910_AMPAM|nr:hypothetical protein FJT64_018231 [Amphibalanus amphitrite]